jgi:hypothetical protein
MLDKFWESMGTNLAGRWLDYIFGPAFLFWAGGIGLYAWKTGWQELLANLQASSQFQQISWIILGLLILVFSSIFVQAIRFPILRLLEGYWPRLFRGLSVKLIARKKKRLDQKRDELRCLKDLEEKQPLDDDQYKNMVELEDWVHWHPAQSRDLLPTSLGNILCAREHSPKRKYGLDAMICWPRLWPMLPETVRADLTDARASLDRMAELCFWGLLFLFWSFLVPWAAVLIAILWMILAYGLACQAAMTYGELLEAAFDLHRLSLYDAIGWPRPAALEDEKTGGRQLTEFLWRGTLP